MGTGNHPRRPKLVFLLVLVFSLVLIHCQSGSYHQSIGDSRLPASLMKLSREGLKALTLVGDCESPSFDRAETHMLVVCSNRPQHKHTEVYEIDLTSGQERRLTFQDGAILNPIYTRSGKIIYSANTDERKEVLTERYLEETPGDLSKASGQASGALSGEGFFELYMMDGFGGVIQRLTRHRGFDGEAVYFPKANAQLYYACNQVQGSSICMMDVVSLRTQVLASAKEDHLAFPTISPDGSSLFWLRGSNGVEGLSLLNKEKRLSFDLPPGRYKDLAHFSDTELILSFQPTTQKAQEPYRVGVFNLLNQQFQLLVEIEGASLEHPVRLRETSRIAFTLRQKDSSRVVWMELPPALLQRTTTVSIFKKNQFGRVE